MKMPLFLALFFFILISSCTSQDKSNSIVNLEDKNFELDTSFFSEDNNIARNAIVVEDGYLIAGQKFTTTDSIQYCSALLKLSLDGKLLKQEFLGNSNSSNHSKIGSIFQIKGDRIIQLGIKQNQLWLREIDSDLNLIKDTLFSINTNPYHRLAVGLKENNFVVVHNQNRTYDLFNISYIDYDLNYSEHIQINNKNSPLNYLNYRVNDAIYDPETGKFFILGEGCSKKTCEDYEYSIIVFNTNSKLIEKTIPLETGKKKLFSRIKIYKGLLYLLGTSNKKLQNVSISGRKISTDHDILVESYTKKGEKVSEFTHNEYLADYPSDMILIKDKILLVGQIFDHQNTQFLSMYLTFDLEGMLLEKRIFGYNNHAGNKLEKVLKISNDKVLLLGKQKGWKVIVDKIKHE